MSKSRPRTLAAVAAVLLVVASAAAYMEYPPKTMKQLCRSPRVRLLKVSKLDKTKGVVIFDLVENLNRRDDKIQSLIPEKIPVGDDKVKTFRQAGFAVAGGKAVLDWAAKDKTAVMFTLENGGDVVSQRACGYVFIDDNCYSVVYNKAGDFWAFIRAEPQMSACYFGKAEKLPEVVRAVLAGKDVKIPTKEPAAKADFAERSKEVFGALNKNK